MSSGNVMSYFAKASKFYLRFAKTTKEDTDRSMMIPHQQSRRVLLFVFILISFLIFFAATGFENQRDDYLSAPTLCGSANTEMVLQYQSVAPAHLKDDTTSDIDTSFSLPVDYNEDLQTHSTSCDSRYGLSYISSLVNTSTSYCTAGSASSLICARTRAAKESRTDVLCIARDVDFNKDASKFDMGCQERSWTSSEEADSVPVLSIGQFPTYWYSTGPGIVFRNFVNVKPEETGRRQPVLGPTADFTILVSREDTVSNPWHSFMEMFSMSLTLDVLRTTKQPGAASPLLKKDDRLTTVIMDDHPAGPFFDMWQAFTGGEILRKHELQRKTLSSSNIIVPLPGGSNPMWEGDWEPHACGPSPLLKVFSKRILSHYGIHRPPLADDRPLVLTFVSRSHKRRLIQQDSLIAALTAEYPQVKVQVVDFAAISLVEQVRIASATDILAGVHGAGLTHAMFMAGDSALVEILPHNLNFMGFRNLARLADLSYFGTHGSNNLTSSHGPQTSHSDWNAADVMIDEEKFLSTMRVAIRSRFNRGLRHDDIV